MTINALAASRQTAEEFSRLESLACWYVCVSKLKAVLFENMIQLISRSLRINVSVKQRSIL